MHKYARQKDTVPSYIVVTIGWTGFWLYGAQMTYQNVRDFDRTAVMETCVGTIEKAEVRKVPTEGGPGYSPEVSYTFTVDGYQYIGDLLGVIGHSIYTRKREAMEKIDGLAPGAAVDVFYDPDDPNFCALDIEVTKGDRALQLWLARGCAALASLPALWLLVEVYRYMRRRSRKA